MPWYNADYSLAFNVFAHLMVLVGAGVVTVVVYSVCWWIFCQTFKLVDRVVNDYHYD